MTQDEKLIFLVRHCQDLPSDNLDADNASQVRLTKHGVRQARALGKFMKKKEVVAVYASIFQRSKETGEIIHAFTGGEYIIDERLNEQIVARAKIGKLEAKELKQRMLDNPHFVPEGGQSMSNAIDAFIYAIKDISSRPHGRICIISHAFLMQAALQRMFKLPLAPQLSEGSISVLSLKNDNFTLLSTNLQPFIFLRIERKVANIMTTIVSLVRNFRVRSNSEIG